jgi:diguanylate cyclase (GGDEF)-like protein
MSRPAPSCATASNYRLLPEGRRKHAALWVEDTGICRIDATDAQAWRRARSGRSTTAASGEERLLYLGSHDELTGQLNRTKLTEALTRFLGSASRTPAKGAFLLAGVNDLTLINETYGYDVGDEVITIVGRRIGRALRGKDCIGRFSSNKFGIVLTDCSEEGVEAIARRLMATIRDSVIDTSVGAVAASISVGAVLLPDHAGNAQAAISRALQALDLVRGSRNDRLGLYEPCERRGAPPLGGHRRRDRPRAQRSPHDPGAPADRHLAES